MEGISYPAQENVANYTPISSSVIEQQLVMSMKRGDRRAPTGPITHEALDQRRAMISSVLGPWALSQT